MKKLVILRGVSGSGKSTRARELMKEHGEGIVCSADDFFMKNGSYNFDRTKLSSAHAWCKGRADAAMYLETPLVIIDNTNTQKWEYESYLMLAEKYGYDVGEEKVGSLDDSSLKTYANRNRHGVPLDVIRKQARRFENG